MRVFGCAEEAGRVSQCSVLERGRRGETGRAHLNPNETRRPHGEGVTRGTCCLL